MKIDPKALGATTFLAVAIAAIAFLVLSGFETPPPEAATPTQHDATSGKDASPSPPPQPPAGPTPPTAMPASTMDVAPESPSVKVPNSPVPATPPKAGGLISGVIVDPLGNPMPMMRAHLIPAGGREKESRPTLTNGVFSLAELEPGAYRLIARREGTRSKDFTGAQNIQLSADEVLTGIRLVYRGGKHTIAGRATDSRGAPIPEVRVSAYSITTIAYGKVETDGDGRYTIEVDGDQAYTVEAHKRGYVTPEAYTPVAPGERDVDFTLAECATIAGQLVDAATGEPIQHFGYARHPGAQTKPDYDSDVFLGVDDPEGRFEIGEVTPGQSTLEFRAHGYAPNMHVLSGIGPGEHVKELRIPMRPGSRIEGQVVNQAGRPVPGATIHLTGRVPLGRLTHNMPRPLFQPNASTDAEGHFEIDAIGDDVTVLMAQQADYADTVAPIDLKPSGTTHIRITMLEGGKIEGTLLVNGLPKPDEKISARVPTRQAHHSHSKTDKDGHFVLTRLPEGDVLVMANVTHDGASRHMDRTVPVSNGHTTRVDLRLQIGTAALSGRVTIGGEIPHGGHVNLFPLDDKTSLEERASCGIQNDGTYLLTGLAAGTYELHTRGWLPGMAVTYQHVVQLELAEGQRHEEPIDLGNARIQGSLAGSPRGNDVKIVVFPGSMDPNSLQLSFTTRAGGLSRALAHGEVGETGAFEINGLSDGEYTIAAVEFDPSGRPMAIRAPRRVHVTESSMVNVDLQTP